MTVSLSVYPQNSDMTPTDSDATKLESAFITDDLINSLRDDLLKSREDSIKENDTKITKQEQFSIPKGSPIESIYKGSSPLNDNTRDIIIIGLVIVIVSLILFGTTGTILLVMLASGLYTFMLYDETVPLGDTVPNEEIKEDYNNVVVHPNVGVRGSKKEPVTFSESLYMPVDSLVAKSQQERNQLFSLVQDAYLNTSPAELFFGKNVNRHTFI